MRTVLGWLSSLMARASPSKRRSATGSLRRRACRIFIATWRFKPGCSALQTSPMPPLPMRSPRSLGSADAVVTILSTAPHKLPANAGELRSIIETQLAPLLAHTQLLPGAIQIEAHGLVLELSVQRLEHAHSRRSIPRA